MQVVVIGGGIIGLSSAYYLAQRSGIDVTLCEKTTLGAGSTERSNGGIRAQFSTPSNVHLSLESLKVWKNFESEFGINIEHRQNGYLLVTGDEATAEVMRENVEMQNAHGVPSEFLAPEETLQYCGELYTDDLVAGTYSPTDGFADPHLALQGFAEKAHESGVDVRTGNGVTDLHVETTGGESRVVGVETPDGDIAADHVVNAAGPWSGRIARMAGVEYPIKHTRRQMITLEPEIPIPESNPLTNHLDRRISFRPEREGVGISSGGFDAEPTSDIDPDGFSKTLDFDYASRALEILNRVAGYFGEETRIRDGWAGLYTNTPDHNPIIERSMPGLVTATGFSGHGFMHSPATGKLVTELVVDGEASLVDISDYSSDRFERQEDHEEQIAL